MSMKVTLTPSGTKHREHAVLVCVNKLWSATDQLFSVARIQIKEETTMHGIKSQILNALVDQNIGLPDPAPEEMFGFYIIWDATTPNAVSQNRASDLGETSIEVFCDMLTVMAARGWRDFLYLEYMQHLK